MVATSHPDSTLAAIETLRAGGNAVDAAIAAAAVLAVVEQQMTGIGGDCFVLYAPAAQSGSDRPVLALNGSGMAPAGATIEAMRSRGVDVIRTETAHAVTVPGAVDAWTTLHGAHGKLPLDRVLAPAIERAEKGFVVSPRVAWDWGRQLPRLLASRTMASSFAPGSRTPSAGDRFANPKLGATLRRIATHGRAGFYEGPVAADVVATLRSHGGVHTEADLAAQRSIWVEPIKTTYRGVDVYECPPNGQGLAALMMLNVYSGYRLGEGDASAVDRIHLLAEATKSVYLYRDALFADPTKVHVPVDQLLSRALADRIRRDISMDRAVRPVMHDLPSHPDTVFLCVVDRDGNTVSFINTLFHTFGSTIYAAESGVVLQSRGISFTLDAKHPNALAPGKRPFHTIIPGMLVKDRRALMPFGVMGAHFQAVGHVHLVSAVLDRGMDPQAAIEEPRSFFTEGALVLERTVPENVRAELVMRGHPVKWADAPHGGAQAIWIDRARGVLVGGSDPRKDGMALGY
ncbi:MAG: gamma-glutamyltransferase family protein [Alphaproteobacteria bacterium]|nr:gamma-glutamyltransferase family protein [Alphaproteobacteria bacterium]